MLSAGDAEFCNRRLSGCSNTCLFSNDGDCDDGGPGSDDSSEEDYKSRYGRMYIEMLKFRREAQASRAEAAKTSRLLEKLQKTLPAVSMAAKLQQSRRAKQQEGGGGGGDG